jgi:hypothetical protein
VRSARRSTHGPSVFVLSCSCVRVHLAL